MALSDRKKTMTCDLGPRPQRQAWLDALRGFAAITVCYYHFSPQLLGEDLYTPIVARFDFGAYGVLLFFLVSGYVIPLSLEKHGSLRRFWIGRIFRMYPAFLFSLVMVALVARMGAAQLPEDLYTETLANGFAHLTLLQNFLGYRGALAVYWTLSFEMLFYLIVAALFVFRLHRYSHWWSVVLVAVSLCLGGLPHGLITPDPLARVVAAVTLFLVVAGSLMAYMSGRRRAVQVAAVAGLLVMAMPMLNGQALPGLTVSPSWRALIMLGVLFSGTTVIQFERGAIGPRTAAWCLTAVGVCALLTHAMNAEAAGPASLFAWPPTAWTATVVAVVLTFAFAYRLRRRAMPRSATFLGRISYSIYLVHLPIMFLLTSWQIPMESPWVRLVVGVIYTALVLTMSWLSYRLIELPGQRLGRRVQRYLDTRWPAAESGAGTSEAGGPAQQGPGRRLENVASV